MKTLSIPKAMRIGDSIVVTFVELPIRKRFNQKTLHNILRVAHDSAEHPANDPIIRINKSSFTMVRDSDKSHRWTLIMPEAVVTIIYAGVEYECGKI